MSYLSPFAALLRGNYTPNRNKESGRPKAPRAQLTGKELAAYITRMAEDRENRRKYGTCRGPIFKEPEKKTERPRLPKSYWRKQGQMAAQFRARRQHALENPAEHPDSMDKVIADEKIKAQRTAKGPSFGVASHYVSRQNPRGFAESLRQPKSDPISPYEPGLVLPKANVVRLTFKINSTTEEDSSPPLSSDDASACVSSYQELDTSDDDSVIASVMSCMLNTLEIADLMGHSVENVEKAEQMQQGAFVTMMARASSPESSEVDKLTEEEKNIYAASLDELARLVAVVRHNSARSHILAPFDLWDMDTGVAVDPLDETLRSLDSKAHKLMQEITAAKDTALSRAFSDYRIETNRNSLQTIDKIREEVLTVVGTKQKETIPGAEQNKTFQSARKNFLKAAQIARPHPLSIPERKVVPKTIILPKQPDPLTREHLDRTAEAIRNQTTSVKNVIEDIRQAAKNDSIITEEGHANQLQELRNMASLLEHQGLLNTTKHEQKLANRQEKVDQNLAELGFIEDQITAYQNAASDLHDLRNTPQNMCEKLLDLIDSLPNDKEKEKSQLQVIFKTYSEKSADHYTQSSYGRQFGRE